MSIVVAIAAAGVSNLSLTSGGQVVAWAGYGQRNVPGGLGNAVAIAEGDNFQSLALTAEGKLVAWGSNLNLKNVAGGLSNVVAIAAGRNYTLALFQLRSSGPERPDTVR